MQSFKHLYIKYRRWRKKKKKLIKKLEKKKVIWQALAKRRWLASLLANKRAVMPLVKYLKATEVGARKKAREKEREWKKKNNQIGKKLFG